MPRVNNVKSAKQRYAMVPVLGENGEVTYRERVLSRPTKKGVTVSRQRVTVADKNSPLPPLKCDYTQCAYEDHAILPGHSYRWIKPKSGPYGGRQRNRHMEHPTWHVWEYSQSLSARIQELQHNFIQSLGTELDDPGEVRDVLETMAEGVRELAEEKRESAANIEEGFGHETSQSEELNALADDLDSWADDIEQADIPDLPDPADADDSDKPDCAECNGEGTKTEDCESCAGEGVDEDGAQCEGCDGSGEGESLDCDDCDGTGKATPDEATEAQMDEWRAEVDEAVGVTEECPV